MVKGKRNGLTFTECSVKICRKKVYSAAFTAILKLKLPQCNAIGVRTPPGDKVSHSSENVRGFETSEY